MWDYLFDPKSQQEVPTVLHVELKLLVCGPTINISAPPLPTWKKAHTIFHVNYNTHEK